MKQVFFPPASTSINFAVPNEGFFPPASTSINFAVPNDKILRQFVLYDTCRERPPGLFVDVLDKSLEGKSCCLTFDGKKLKQGLTENAGDVDLLGFEQGTALNERKMILQFGLQTIENMRKCLADSHDLLINNNPEIQANLRNFLL
ncbi:LOW QUALITY PROTEIN: hypothetical protein MAR_005818, partial [Mya arenaria]